MSLPNGNRAIVTAAFRECFIGFKLYLPCRPMKFRINLLESSEEEEDGRVGAEPKLSRPSY